MEIGVLCEVLAPLSVHPAELLDLCWCEVAAVWIDEPIATRAQRRDTRAAGKVHRDGGGDAHVERLCEPIQRDVEGAVAVCKHLSRQPVPLVPKRERNG